LTESRIGVVALQGDFMAHRHRLAQLPVSARLVREPEELAGLDGVILPGGESTTMTRLGSENGLWPELKQRVRQGLAVMGTCAGVIMLARRIERDAKGIRPLGLLDIVLQRNAYGSQVDSFESELSLEFGDATVRFPGVFIRAPKITEFGEGVSVIARCGEDPVFVQQGRVWGLTFHPELTPKLDVHRRFVKMASEDWVRMLP